MGRGCRSTSDEVKASAGQDDVPPRFGNLAGFAPHPWRGEMVVGYCLLVGWA
jgi:hypothetical protein